MIEERKEYWIRLFIRKCLSLDNYEKQIIFFIKWCEKTYNASEKTSKKLKEKYTIDDYINRLTPIIDKRFTTDDLKASIKFYSSDAGKKILDYQFLQDVEKISKEMGEEIENSFANNK